MPCVCQLKAVFFSQKVTFENERTRRLAKRPVSPPQEIEGLGHFPTN